MERNNIPDWLEHLFESNSLQPHSIRLPLQKSLVPVSPATAGETLLVVNLACARAARI